MRRGWVCASAWGSLLVRTISTCWLRSTMRSFKESTTGAVSYRLPNHRFLSSSQTQMQQRAGSALKLGFHSTADVSRIDGCITISHFTAAYTASAVYSMCIQQLYLLRFQDACTQSVLQCHSSRKLQVGKYYLPVLQAQQAALSLSKQIKTNHETSNNTGVLLHAACWAGTTGYGIN